MIAAVVLAAGASTRLGRPKQLLSAGGQSLVKRAVACCVGARCHPVVVVLGADAELVGRELEDTIARPALNEDWREGMASSVRTGVEALPVDVEATILLVCDQPRISPEILEKLRDAYDRTPGRIVACEYSGTLGGPALFHRDRFSELLQLRGEDGAKPILLRHAAEIVRVPWPDGAVDIDRLEDLEGLRHR